MASWYFQRGEEKAGPFSTEEMAEFLRDGRIGYTDRVMREAEDQWWPVHSMPELEAAARRSLVTRGVASDPPSDLPALASRQTPARASVGGSVARNSAWTAGQPPRRPGIFVRFAHPLPEVGALLEGAGALWTAVETGRSRVRWSLVALLLGLMFLLAWIDRQAGFGTSFFSALVPFCLAGAVLVLLATRRGGGPSPRDVWERARHFGLFALVLAPFAFFVGGVLLSVLLRIPLLAGILAAVAVLVVRWRRKAAPDPGRSLWSTRLSAVTRTLEALRDDAAPGKPTTGWLDLTGAEQRHKLLARSRSRSGAAAEVYRDDWWSLALSLRDGNRLRITASDRLKLKRGRWRQGARKYKWKPGSERRLSSVDLRLRVNPELYRIATDPPMPYVTISGDTLSTAFDARDGLETKDLLRSLSLLYKRLEPLSGKAVEG